MGRCVGVGRRYHRHEDSPGGGVRARDDHHQGAREQRPEVHRDDQRLQVSGALFFSARSRNRLLPSVGAVGIPGKGCGWGPVVGGLPLAAWAQAGTPDSLNPTTKCGLIGVSIWMAFVRSGTGGQGGIYQPRMCPRVGLSSPCTAPVSRWCWMTVAAEAHSWCISCLFSAVVLSGISKASSAKVVHEPWSQLPSVIVGQSVADDDLRRGAAFGVEVE